MTAIDKEIMDMLPGIIYDNPMITDDMDEKEFARVLRVTYNTLEKSMHILRPDIA
jgi:hypothetical protein